MRPNSNTDRALYAILGALLGMLFACLLSAAALALLGGPRRIAPSAPPPDYAIEAVVEEDYVNRTMLDSASWLPLPFPLMAGHLDIHTGAVGDFAVKMQIGPMQPVFRGSTALRVTDAGRLEAVLVQAKAGLLPVTGFVPAGLLDDINAAINEQLKERIGDTGVKLVGVTSDETTLRFFLVGLH
jgi:hypothetical protein